MPSGQNDDMNIATLLKSEILRLSRKEVRGETHALKKVANRQRSEIAALKRRVDDLEKQMRRQAKSPPAQRQADETVEPQSRLRFSPKTLAAQRKRLGLSANDIGLLVGASGQSIYNWENGQNRPRTSQLPAIAELRKLGKKAAVVRLEALRAAAA
jgi:DNA-binding transcriptional regulator YiaG